MRAFGKSRPSGLEIVQAEAEWREVVVFEFENAQAAGDHDRMTDLMLAAIDLDRAAPGGRRLMNDIRAMRPGRGGRR